MVPALQSQGRSAREWIPRISELTDEVSEGRRPGQRAYAGQCARFGGRRGVMREQAVSLGEISANEHGRAPPRRRRRSLALFHGERHGPARPRLVGLRS